MRLRIRHETHYRMAEPASCSVQYLRLTPRPETCQKILGWKVSGPPNLVPWTDGFGNRAHMATERARHHALTIVAEGEVETEDTCGVLPLDDGLPPPMFLKPTPLTLGCEEVVTLASQVAGVRADDGDVAALHRLNNIIADRVSYRPGTTDVTSTVADVLAAGSGVCQDHTHLFIACCRELGLACRYVSGYLHSEHHEMASHAWAECHVPGLGWVSFDPTNRQSATDAYVRLAVGFDYTSAAPIIGLRTGGADESLVVKVEVQSQMQQ